MYFLVWKLSYFNLNIHEFWQLIGNPIENDTHTNIHDFKNDHDILFIFRVLLHEIGYGLIKEERKVLLLMAKSHLPQCKVEGMETSQSIFLALENAESLSPQKLSVLQESLQALKRKDLIDKIAKVL